MKKTKQRKGEGAATYINGRHPLIVLQKFLKRRDE
tara:strand:+ start:364 stop:468 length:105 start_codon:yes stop_codon:yes gene_type:complete